ncbi:MAG TPA: DUF6600 domain-containing protein [Bryobacteraceae bacterium]|nr:DUF6600 domain-containing protein [Bryobacteraceae bacterium]
MKFYSGVISLWAFAAMAGALWSQSSQAPQDPPARVARLSYVDGPVSFRADDQQEWAPAALNYPFTNGDHIWTDKAAFAELHIGATALHMPEETALGILKLDGKTAQLSLSQGLVYLRIPRMDDDQLYEVDTPNAAILLRNTGDYRLGVSEDGLGTTVTVRSGEAHVEAGAHTYTVRPGKTLQVVGGDALGVDTIAAAEPDPWEDWCVGRDRLAEHSESVSDSYVAPEMTGSEDLGQYGTWVNDDTYGVVWLPSGVDTKWAPYHNGHWAWVSPWGWTWIDDAPWGFAPFHYGRWVKTPNGWVWLPGPRGVHPVYAPALVSFIRARGAGGRPSSGLIGWIPLGPGEVYRPAYKASDAYVRRLNGGETANPNNRALANAAAATAVPQATFAGGRQVASSAVRMPADGAAAASLDDLRPVAGRTGTKTPAPPPAVIARRVRGEHETPAVVAAPASAPPVERPTQRVTPTQSSTPSPAPAAVADSNAAQEEAVRASERQRAQQQADQERQQQAQQQRQAELQRQADQQRAEQQRQAQAEQQRQAEQLRQAELQRQAEQRRAEQQRQEQQRQEQQRQEQQRAEQQRQEQQRQELQRQEQQRQEQQRQAEEQRQAAEKKAADEKKAAEKKQ